MINLKINDSLSKIYSFLGFSEEETESTIKQLTAVQLAAASAEMIKILTADEFKTLKESVQKSKTEIMGAMRQIVESHINDKEFAIAANAAVKKVFDEHIEYLKAKSSEDQKKNISEILNEA